MRCGFWKAAKYMETQCETSESLEVEEHRLGMQHAAFCDSRDKCNQYRVDYFEIIRSNFSYTF